MIRSFVVLLLLVVVFLIGMLLGIDREQNANPQGIQSEIATTETIADIINKRETDDEQVMVIGQSNDTEVPLQSTQMIASFLEHGVKGFYDVVVEVLYQISSLFI